MPQSYKIFVRDKPLIISASAEGMPSGYKELDKRFTHEPAKFLDNEALWQEAEGFYFLSGKPDSAMQLLKQNLRLIYAAGGIVWNENNELLMIHRRGYWDLPKGKVDEDESLEEAALREVEEETGLNHLKINKLKAITYHTYLMKEWVLKETHWYEMLHTGKAALLPQAEEDILEARWVNKTEISSRIAQSYASIKEIFGSL